MLYNVAHVFAMAWIAAGGEAWISWWGLNNGDAVFIAAFEVDGSEPWDGCEVNLFITTAESVESEN